MTTYFIIGFILVTLIVGYYRPRMWLWSLAELIYLAICYRAFQFEINSVVFDVLAIIVIAMAVILNIKFLRMILTKVIYTQGRKAIPSISETEQLALNAGEPWFETEVFRGQPDFKLLHNIKKFSLTDEERSFVENETETLCSMINDWQITHKDYDLPVEVWNYLREHKFFGLVIAKEYGGRGFSAAAHSEVVLKIATKSVTAAVTVMVPNSLGPGELLYHYGTTEQKNTYLPRLAVGQEIPCFALTGTTAGSDATSIPDEGIVCYGEHNGKKVLGLKLRNVNKRYITLAPVATLVGLALLLKDPDGLLAGVGREGITCALLPNTHEGLEIGNRLFPLNQSFMNGTIRIKESFIPIDWIIGGQAMAGEGWRMLVECLSIGRSISLPACGTANALFSTVMTSAYAATREQFKTAIGNFEGVEEVLARMAGRAYFMNATRQLTINALDSGVRPSVASAIAKYHLTENGRSVVEGAMDIHAGRGIIMGPSNYLARAYQGIPIGITVEGANIMTRNLMIFGQGAMRCHPFIRKEYEALSSEHGVNDFDAALFGHIGYFIQNKTRAIFHGFTCGVFAKGYNSKFNCYYKKITRLSSSFAFINDLALIVLGGELKRKERLSARLGDVMSYLYMACASLKYFDDNGKRQTDEVFLKWSLEHCLFEAQNALIEVLDNFTVSWLGKVVKFVTFPYGKPFKKPSDRLEHMISQSLLHNSETRQAFKKYCYIPDNFNDPVGKVEVTFSAVLKLSIVKDKIHKARKEHKIAKGEIVAMATQALEVGVITQEEFNHLAETEKMVAEVVKVDEFKPYELGPKNAHPEWKHA